MLQSWCVNYQNMLSCTWVHYLSCCVSSVTLTVSSGLLLRYRCGVSPHRRRFVINCHESRASPPAVQPTTPGHPPGALSVGEARPSYEVKTQIMIWLSAWSVLWESGCDPVVSLLLQVQRVVSGQLGGAQGGSALPLPESAGGGRWSRRRSQLGEHAAGGVFLQGGSSAGHCGRRVGGHRHTSSSGAGSGPGLQPGWIQGVLWSGWSPAVTHTLHGAVPQVNSPTPDWNLQGNTSCAGSTSCWKPRRKSCTSTSDLLIYKCCFLKYIYMCK